MQLIGKRAVLMSNAWSCTLDTVVLPTYSAGCTPLCTVMITGDFRHVCMRVAHVGMDGGNWGEVGNNGDAHVFLQ